MYIYYIMSSGLWLILFESDKRKSKSTFCKSNEVKVKVTKHK